MGAATVLVPARGSMHGVSPAAVVDAGTGRELVAGVSYLDYPQCRAKKTTRADAIKHSNITMFCMTWRCACRDQG